MRCLLPPSGRSSVGGGRSAGARSASGRACSPQPGPSGLGSGERSAPRADRFRSRFPGRSSPGPSGAAKDDHYSVSVRLTWTGMIRFRLYFASSWSSIAWRNQQV